MRLFLLGALALLCGCATSHTTIHPTDNSLSYLRIEPGKLTYFYKNGKQEETYFPRESQVDIKDGHPITYNSGLGRELELGWDAFAFQPHPLVMVRLFYLSDFGLAVGADENAFVAGFDWRYKDVLIGPLIGSPWLNSRQLIWGAKIALPVRF